MKKINLIKKMFSLFIPLFLGSCNEYESVDDTAISNSNIKSYYISGSEAKKVAEKFASKHNKLLNTNDVSFKIKEDINVNYESILVVENELKHKSYTFKVESTTESESVFQNIAIIEKPDQTVTKLLTFKMSDNFAAKYAADLVPITQFEGAIDIETINGEDCCSDRSYITIGQVGGGDSSGGTTGGSYDGSSGNIGGGATGGWGIGWSGGSGSSSGGNGGGFTGGGGGCAERCPSGMHIKGDHNCRFTKVDTSPILSNRIAPTASVISNPTTGTPREICCVYDIGLYNEALVYDACKRLEKLKKDRVLKTKLATLFQSAKTDNFEKYSVVYKDPTPNTQTGQEDAFDYVEANGLPNATSVEYPINTNAQGVMHSHYAGLNSIFSPGDLQDLFLKMREPLITDEFFISLVTAEGTAYVLQVKDRQAFIAFGNLHLADDKKINKFTNNLYLKKYNLASSNKIENEKNFLKMMSENNLGLSLSGTFFMADATPSPNLFNNLQTKVYNKDTDSVELFNCN